MGRVKITDDDIVTFTEGDCNVLAEVIHNKTGWSFAAFHQDGWLDLHAFVITPSGKYLDVEGVHSYDDFVESWKCTTIIATTPEKLYKEWGPNLFSHSRTRAEKIAPILIKQAKEIDDSV